MYKDTRRDSEKYKSYNINYVTEVGISSSISNKKRRSTNTNNLDQLMNNLPKILQDQWLIGYQLWDMASHDWDVDSLRNFTFEFNHEFIMSKCTTKYNELIISRSLIHLTIYHFLNYI